jgi:hypothetical protein
VLLHGNFIARKRAEMMMAAHCAATGVPPPPECSAAAAASAHCLAPTAVYGPAADEMMVTCGCVAPRRCVLGATHRTRLLVCTLVQSAPRIRKCIASPTLTLPRCPLLRSSSPPASPPATPARASVGSPLSGLRARRARRACASAACASDSDESSCDSGSDSAASPLPQLAPLHALRLPDKYTNVSADDVVEQLPPLSPAVAPQPPAALPPAALPLPLPLPLSCAPAAASSFSSSASCGDGAAVAPSMTWQSSLSGAVARGASATACALRRLPHFLDAPTAAAEASAATAPAYRGSALDALACAAAMEEDTEGSPLAPKTTGRKRSRSATPPLPQQQQLADDDASVACGADGGAEASEGWSDVAMVDAMPSRGAAALPLMCMRRCSSDVAAADAAAVAGAAAAAAGGSRFGAPAATPPPSWLRATFGCV